MSGRSKRRAALNPELQDQITRGMVEKLFGGGGSREPEGHDLPDYCGECRFFHKVEGFGHGRCHRNPPDFPGQITDEALARMTGFGTMRPAVLPEDFGCGVGERGR